MLKILLLTLFSFAPADSLRTETVNGTLFIIHQVSGGETLYAIARRYKTSVDGIRKANENTEAGIKEGQILRIPFDKKEKKSVSTPVRVKEKEIEKKTHTVAAKETLSAIAKKYGLSIKQLKELNALESDQVKIGQILLVSGNKSAVAEKKEVKQEIAVEKKIEKKETRQNVEKPVVAEKKQVKEAVKPAEKKEELIKISESVADSDEMKEVGTAEIMEGTDGTRKYLAIHRSIKVGSIVKVRNDATNKEVFVRVSGSMPAGVDEKTVIKISRAAFERLGGTDSSLQAEVTYYK
jgi:LysM repeat protein